jgi:hypothetical protein
MMNCKNFDIGGALGLILQLLAIPHTNSRISLFAVLWHDLLGKKALRTVVWMVVVGASMSNVASNVTSFQTLDKTQNRNIKINDHWTKMVEHTN